MFSVARRFDPEIDVFMIADACRPVQCQAGFTVLPNYSISDAPAMNAFLIPGGFGTRQETYNGRLHSYINSLPKDCLLTSVCTGSWMYGEMGLLDGLVATNRKEPDFQEMSANGMVPIDRLTALLRSLPPVKLAVPGWLTAVVSLLQAESVPVWKWAFTCLGERGMIRRLFPKCRVMEYSGAYELYKNDVQIITTR